MAKPRRPRLGVFKFSSCDGCQLSLLNLGDQLLALRDRVEIAYFLEASSAPKSGPYDVALVEGSISAPADVGRVQRLRRRSRTLVAIGACATGGGIQALRNSQTLAAVAGRVYPRPEQLRVLPRSTPISAHVPVDLELAGCPVDGQQLLETIVALLDGRRPAVYSHSVCVDCKLRGLDCVQVALGIPCMGPVTRSGCGALCPAVSRGCYGCFGPAETFNAPALLRSWDKLGESKPAVQRSLRTYNAAAPKVPRGADGNA